MSLYLNLRKYLETESRDPKEPYLTNAVVDFLNRIPPQASRDFIFDVLLNTPATTDDAAAFASLSRLRSLLRPAPRVVWKREDAISHLGACPRNSYLTSSVGRIEKGATAEQ
jgi:hypothetical protein